MIINWLLYSVLVGGIFALAGAALDYGLRTLKLPTRWVWLAVMTMSTVFSALTLAKGLVRPKAATQAEYSIPTAASAIDSDSVPTHVWNARESAKGRSAVRAQSTALTPALERVLNSTGGLPAAIGVPEATFESLNTPLLVACAVMAIGGLITLLVILARLSGVAYALDHGVVEGVPVLLSRNIGPALLGVRRFRVVIPRWVTEMSAADIRTILTHEKQHAKAGDPTLIHSALLMTALQPWNPALWFALSRLRLATETDCDARVLGTNGDARHYGHLLVDVYQRAQPGLSPLTSFVTPSSQLEARIRRLVDAAPKSFSPRTIAAFSAGLMLCTVAYSLEVTAQGTGTRSEPSAVPVVSAVDVSDASKATALAAKAAPEQRAPAPAAKSDTAPAAAKPRKYGHPGYRPGYPETPAEADFEIRRAMDDLAHWDSVQRTRVFTTPRQKPVSDTIRKTSPKNSGPYVMKLYPIRGRMRQLNADTGGYAQFGPDRALLKAIRDSFYISRMGQEVIEIIIEPKKKQVPPAR